MKLLGVRQLSVLLIGTLLLCHGVFGALHLVCYPPLCAGDAEHEAAVGAVGDTHDHPVDHEGSHGTSAGYFAVFVLSILGLLLGLLSKRASLRITLDARWPVVLRRVPAVLRPPPTHTLPTLQVFRL